VLLASLLKVSSTAKKANTGSQRANFLSGSQDKQEIHPHSTKKIQ